MVGGSIEMTIIDKLIEADKSKKTRIMVIGDGMTDVYVNGRIESCQDGCTKFVKESEVRVPGGALNAARSLSNWNTQVYCMYPKGSGAVKTRFIIDDKITSRYDDDTINCNLELVQKESLASLGILWYDGVLITDYDKGLITREFVTKIVDHCNKYKIPCVSDAKRHSDLYKDTIIKGNYEWRYKGGVGNVITHADLPPLVNDKTLLLNLPRVKSVNHVGAGDCFAAHLILALAYGFSLKESAEIAYSAGRVYVQHRHNRPPYPHEIALDMNSKLEISSC